MSLDSDCYRWDLRVWFLSEWCLPCLLSELMNQVFAAVILQRVITPQKQHEIQLLCSGRTHRRHGLRPWLGQRPQRWLLDEASSYTRELCDAHDDTPNLPTKIITAKIAGLKISRNSPMDMRIPPLKLKILLESSPLKSRILVGRLGVFVVCPWRHQCGVAEIGAYSRTANACCQPMLRDAWMCATSANQTDTRKYTHADIYACIHIHIHIHVNTTRSMYKHLMCNK